METIFYTGVFLFSMGVLIGLVSLGWALFTFLNTPKDKITEYLTRDKPIFGRSHNNRNNNSFNNLNK